MKAMAITINPSSYSLLFLLPLSLAFHPMPVITYPPPPPGPTHSIESTCNAIIRHSIAYDYCFTTLSLASTVYHTVPRRPNQAASIAYLAYNRVKDSISRIDRFIVEQNVPKLILGKYRVCVKAYNNAFYKLDHARFSINTKDYAKAHKQLMDSRGAYRKCHAAFKGTGSNPPVMKQDQEYEKMIKITLAILHLVRSQDLGTSLKK